MDFRFSGKRFRRILLYLQAAVCAMAFLSLSDAFGSSGECALAFLNQPIGARSASLGQAGFAGIDGPEAIFGNSSLIGNRASLYASHQELLLDTRAESFAFSIPLSQNYSIGAAAYIFEPGKIDGYSSDNTKTNNVPSGDRLVRMALSRSGKIRYGLSVSYYNQRLDNLVGDGLGFGGGIAIETGYGRIAASVDNLGQEFKIGADKFPLPTRYILSAWLPLRLEYLDLSLDLIHSGERDFAAAAGLEYKMSETLSLRAGSGTLDRLTLGLAISSGPVALDYSYLPLGIFGDRHLVSIRISH